MSKLKPALDLVPEKIEAMINDYRDELEKAWLKRDDTESLTINFAAKFGFEKGDNICTVSIAFTPEKITDHTKFAFDEKQGKLPLGVNKEHVWNKTNLVTIAAKGKVPMHDVYECGRCGATAKRFGTAWPPTIDKKFAKRTECPGEKK